MSLPIIPTSVAATTVYSSTGPLPTPVEAARTKVKANNRTRHLDVARELTLEASRQLTVWCPITGLTIETGLPASFDITLSSLHPMAYNGAKFLDYPAYIKTLSNKELSGLILTLLAEAGKISISPKSNAYLVRAKLESISTRNNLLDLIEWIANSLYVTTLHYPPLKASHTDLTLDSLKEWMTWTYSIETYSFGGSTFELESVEGTKVKPPKALSIESMDAKIKRLNKQFNSSVKELVAAYFTYSGTTVVAEKIINNLSPLLKDKVNDPNPKLDSLLATIATEDSPEVVDAANDLISLREAAAKAASNANELLDSAIEDAFLSLSSAEEAPNPDTIDKPAPAPAPVVEAKVEAKVEEKKLSFAERLAALAAKKESI